jgi:hypothetical protein
MINPRVQKFSGRVRFATLPFAILAIWATGGAFPGLAQPSAQPRFQSTFEASQTLFQAVQTNHEEAIAKILGGPTELTSSRDAGQDKIEREMFVEKYHEMHRLGREADGSVTLYIGAENWPFPIPLVATNGAWRFDREAGAKEVTFRRIGDNELTAIANCHEFAAAENRYRADPNTVGPVDISCQPCRESGQRICRRKSRTVAWLLFPRTPEAGGRRPAGWPIRSCRLFGGVPVLRCDDFRHFGERYCL